MSHLEFLGLVGTDALDLKLYRSDLDAATLMAGSMDSISTFWRVSEWLGESGLSQVSHLKFLGLFVIEMLDFQSSIFTPKLPQHPGPKGKSCQCSDILFRSLP